MEHHAPPGAESDTIAAFTARFGPEALDLCGTVVERLATDPDLAARVAHRHALLAAQSAVLGAAHTLATARAAGRRAMLVVLLLECGERFFAA